MKLPKRTDKLSKTISFSLQVLVEAIVSTLLWNWRYQFQFDVLRQLIIYMKKLLDFDWLRAVQFKCNTSAKSVTPVQITKK